MCVNFNFGSRLILYAWIAVASGTYASHLIVLLENVPYNANFTLLCSEVVDLYFNSTPDSLEGYCNSSMELRYDRMEVAEVSFMNASQPYALPMDVYPALLNSRLSESGFFDLWAGGKVKLVANHLRLDVEVLIIMSILMFANIIFICTICYATTCCRPGRGYSSIIPA